MKTALWTVVAWLTGHVVLIAGHVALVFLYSVAIAPGLTNEEYSAFALASGPWFSIVAGGPVFYLLGRLLVRRLGAGARAAGLVAWVLYCAVDASVVLATTDAIGSGLAAQWIASQSVKLVAILWATRAAEGEADAAASV